MSCLDRDQDRDQERSSYPQPRPNWALVESASGRRATYSRLDGWRVEVEFRADFQIMGPYMSPTVKFWGADVNVPGIGWGPSSVLKCMDWVDKTFPCRRREEVRELDAWVVLARDFLDRVSGGLPVDPQEARRLAASCPETRR